MRGATHLTRKTKLQDDIMVKDKIIERLDSLFKEELWGRIEPKDIGISKFKILDDLFNSVVTGDCIDITVDLCKKHIEEHEDSITAMYLIGLIGYHTDTIEDTLHLRKLIDLFIDNHKWAVVEILAEKILEYGESSYALRALAVGLERLGRHREAIPVWEDLLKMDRFDAEVAKKLAYAIIDDEPDKSIQYMKMSIEGFIKNRQYDEVTSLWNKLINISWDDFAFFERIERMLVDEKEIDLVATLLKTLLNKYRDEENPDQSIEILKKILEYRPDDNHSRRELVKYYKIKYENHSELEQFLKLSRLNNFKAPVKYAIQDFEKSIVFDKDNYAFHSSWGLGKILEINSDYIIISFKDKPEHRMSIQMALQSLTPVRSDHLYVMEYEDPETLKSLFSEDFIEFFHVLVKSYDGEILLADIKKELIPKYVDEKSWPKWWSRARTTIKKDPLFAISDKKKDLIYMRDKPVTFADELIGSFTQTDSFSQRLDIAIEFINNIDKEEGASVAQYLIDFFLEESRGDSATRQILSYFILTDLERYVDSSKLKLDTIRTRVIDFIKTSQELPIISMKISSYDYKKTFVNLIEETREDWPDMFSELLFETPVRIHKYIINSLIRARAYNIINAFIDRAIIGSKQYPDIFIWVFKNIATKAWDYEWLDYSIESLVINYFRLMSELKKIEVEGNRLKNMTLDLLFDNNAAVLRFIISQFDKPYVRKIYDLFNSVSYIEDSDSEKFQNVIDEYFEDFSEEEDADDEESAYDTERFIVTKEGYEMKKAEFNKLVNVEMVNLSKELSKVSEASPDLRENVEYNALLEKQATLELSISKLDDELRQADILDVNSISTDMVNIGTRVKLEDVESGEEREYAILGPWDADFEQKILSYRSPIAKAILGHKKGEEVGLRIDDETRKFIVKSISTY